MRDLKLTLDVELTSFEEKNNLITCYLGIIENNEIIDELYLKLIPDEGYFTIDPECMVVNNIDIRNWEGIRYKDARKLIGKFIRKYVYDEKGGRIGNRLLPIGQDVSSDIKIIQRCLISKETWNQCVRLIPIDILYFATILRDMGLLNLKSLSLQSLAEYFGLDASGAHDAKFDALLVPQVYEKLKELL